jgi:hypothetical protein
MTVYVYGLDAGDVVEDLPGIDPSQITVHSLPVNIPLVSQWIKEGAAKINGLLLRSGVHPGDNLDANTHATVAQAVKSYAISRAAARLGDLQSEQRAHERWNQTYQELASRPQNLGGDYDDRISTQYDHEEPVERWSFIGFDRKW